MDDKVLCRSVSSKLLMITCGVLVAIGFVVFIALWPSAYNDIGVLYPLLGIEFVYFLGIVVFYVGHKSIQLTVTDRRVYGVTSFGKRVDLPMDSISAISTSMWKTIAVTTASGAIKFSFIENIDEMYRILNEQLMERQNRH